MTLRMNITPDQLKTAQVRAVNRALEYVLGKSNEKVPLEYGDLQRSGRVDMDGTGEPSGQITYDSPYAVIQHENLAYNHAPGREAKYLENAVIDNQPQIARILQQGFTSGLST